jgi:hypothetical protein
MPAFGAYAGGLNVLDDTFLDTACGQRPTVPDRVRPLAYCFCLYNHLYMSLSWTLPDRARLTHCVTLQIPCIGRDGLRGITICASHS